MKKEIYYRLQFSQMLKYLRVTRQLKQSELAKELNVARTTITSIELGSRAPSFELLLAIADYFDISLDTLLGRKEFTRGKIRLDHPDIDAVMTIIDTMETSRKYDTVLKERFDKELKKLDESDTNDTDDTDDTSTD